MTLVCLHPGHLIYFLMNSEEQANACALSSLALMYVTHGKAWFAFLIWVSLQRCCLLMHR